MSIVVQIEPPTRAPAEVDYRWDADTDILTANCRATAVSEGTSDTVELTGNDGSWLVLDVASGSIAGIEVAVWPDVRKVAALLPPADAVEDARLVIPARSPVRDVSLDADAPLVAEADQTERTIHFRLGRQRSSRTVRIARDILIEVDRRNTIAGVWLLNVPPFPADA